MDEELTNEVTINIEEVLNLPNNSVTDAYTLRQIGLATTEQGLLTKEQCNVMYKKIQKGFEYGALYPHVMKTFKFPSDWSEEKIEKMTKLVDELIEKRKND